MEILIVVIECICTIILGYAYYRLCYNRDADTATKLIEIVSLYGVTILAFMDRIKFIVWFICIIAIGIMKFITTKRSNSERKSL